MIDNNIASQKCFGVCGVVTLREREREGGGGGEYHASSY